MELMFCLQINTKVFYKLIVSLWVCVASHARSIRNNKFTISLQYLKENVNDKVDFLSANWYCHFRCVWRSLPKLFKIISCLFLSTVLRRKWVMKLIFCMQISMKSYCKWMQCFWWGWSSIPKVTKLASLQCLYNISKKELEMRLIFCKQTNIKVSDKLISTLWASNFPTRWYYHSWWTWSTFSKYSK